MLIIGCEWLLLDFVAFANMCVDFVIFANCANCRTSDRLTVCRWGNNSRAQKRQRENKNEKQRKKEAKKENKRNNKREKEKNSDRFVFLAFAAYARWAYKCALLVLHSIAV